MPFTSTALDKLLPVRHGFDPTHTQEQWKRKLDWFIVERWYFSFRASPSSTSTSYFLERNFICSFARHHENHRSKIVCSQIDIGARRQQSAHPKLNFCLNASVELVVEARFSFFVRPCAIHNLLVPKKMRIEQWKIRQEKEEKKSLKLLLNLYNNIKEDEIDDGPWIWAWHGWKRLRRAKKKMKIFEPLLPQFKSWKAKK